jgi:hypothetical protein
MYKVLLSRFLRFNINCILKPNKNRLRMSVTKWRSVEKKIKIFFVNIEKGHTLTPICDGNQKRR